MRRRQDSLTITLHWGDRGGERSANVVCEDVAPDQLLPLLLDGCGIATASPGGVQHELRVSPLGRRALRPGERLSQQGVRSGAHLWLVERGVAVRRCVVALPDGSELLIPRAGAQISRDWLLQALALLSPAAHAEELRRIERRDSPFRYVSSRTHCAIAHVGQLIAVSTARSDVVTRLNGASLRPGVPAPLDDGDLLALGDGGLTLSVSVLLG